MINCYVFKAWIPSRWLIGLGPRHLNRLEGEKTKKNKLISENHQDLGRIPIMVGGEKLFSGYKNIKNSLERFVGLCMPAPHTWAMCLTPFRPRKGKIITRTNNLSREERSSSSRRLQTKTQPKSPKKKTFVNRKSLLLLTNISCLFFLVLIWKMFNSLIN